MKLASLVPRVTPVLQYHSEWPIPLGGKIIHKQKFNIDFVFCLHRMSSSHSSPVLCKVLKGQIYLVNWLSVRTNQTTDCI